MSDGEPTEELFEDEGDPDFLGFVNSFVSPPFLPDDHITVATWLELTTGAAQSDSEWYQLASRCREALERGYVSAQVLKFDGTTIPVPSHRWRDQQFWERNSLRGDNSGGVVEWLEFQIEPGTTERGRMIVSEEQATPGASMATLSDLSRQEDWTIELTLMVRAVREIPLTRANARTVNNDLIVKYLEGEARGRVATSKIKEMAKLLTHPRTRTGGVRSAADNAEISRRFEGLGVSKPEQETVGS